MGRRAVVVFWGSVSATVLFLGSAWSVWERASHGARDAATMSILFVGIVGFAGSALVAGRITTVVGRVRRQGRHAQAGDVAARRCNDDD